MLAMEGASFHSHSVASASVSSCRYGLTSRQWGLTLDTVIGATVVLADGSIVNASASQYQDLFWVAMLSAL